MTTSPVQEVRGAFGSWEPERVTKPEGFVTVPRSGPNPRSWGLGDVALGVASSLVLAVLAASIVMAATGWESPDEFPMWVTVVLQVPLWAGLVGAVAWAGTKGGGIRIDFKACQRWFDPLVGLAVGVATQIIVLPLLYLPLLALMGKTEDDLARPARELSDRADGAAGWILLVLLVVIGAPLVEELFYRGLLMRSLEKRSWPQWAAVVVSAAAFAAMHLQSLQFPGLFVFGLILGALAVSFDRLGPAIWAHVAFNATTVISLYLTA